jgi:hypothetical protein
MLQKLYVCCSYHVVLKLTNSVAPELNDTKLEDQKLQLGGVYTLIIQENDNEIVSKHEILFSCNINIMNFWHLSVCKENCC